MRRHGRSATQQIKPSRVETLSLLDFERGACGPLPLFPLFSPRFYTVVASSSSFSTGSVGHRRRPGKQATRNAVSGAQNWPRQPHLVQKPHVLGISPRKEMSKVRAGMGFLLS